MIELVGNKPYEGTADFETSYQSLFAGYTVENRLQKEGNYGLQTKLKFNCDNCGKFVESNMPSIYTFFRPKFTFDTTK